MVQIACRRRQWRRVVGHVWNTRHRAQISQQEIPYTGGALRHRLPVAGASDTESQQIFYGGFELESRTHCTVMVHHALLKAGALLDTFEPLEQCGEIFFERVAALKNSQRLDGPDDIGFGK